MRTTIHCVDGSVVAGANASEALRGLDFKRSLELARPNRYLVCWGLGESEQEFSVFADALACYVEHLNARGGAKIWNTELCDYGCDGLTGFEREAVELADEMHTVGVA